MADPAEILPLLTEAAMAHLSYLDAEAAASRARNRQQEAFDRIQAAETALQEWLAARRAEATAALQTP